MLSIASTEGKAPAGYNASKISVCLYSRLCTHIYNDPLTFADSKKRLDIIESDWLEIKDYYMSFFIIDIFIKKPA